MLDTLYIKNFAIIDQLEVTFGSGLNVLSGETGAGKSIIIGSINFVLGGKADRELIKTGRDMCEVSAIVSVDNDYILNKLSEIDIDVDEDGSLMLKRTLNSSGKSVCRVNGITVTLSMLKQISSLIFDIHSQHDNHKLLNSKNHIDILDKLCPHGFKVLMNTYLQKYTHYNEILSKIKELDREDKDIQYKIDLYSYQIEEIENANLHIGEEEELSQRRSLLINSVKLQNSAENILDVLYRKDNSAIDGISEAIGELSFINDVDNGIVEYLDELNSAYSAVEDVVSFVRSYADNIESDPEELNNIENRISLIYELKKKYGSSIDEILSYKEDISNKLNTILNSTEILEEYKKQSASIKKEIISICKDITEIRSKTAENIGNKIKENLYDLSMEAADFKIVVTEEDSFSSKGNNNVEFMISANKGEPLKPLSKVASGGEMSRVMLALKTVLANSENIDTFIFDEIDTGISGRTAQKVAEKLNIISNNHQILCITHLPQIAAMADSNYLIKKSSDDVSTSTDILPLDGDEIYNELARLIGGTEITDATLLAAKEMKIMTNKLKESR